MKLPVNYDNLSREKRREVREEYIRIQEGLCCHCEGSLKKRPPFKILAKPVDQGLFPEGFFRWPVHLHHSHDNGLTIGAVHAYCNAVLWQYYGE